uniref:Enoyl reductase (ER) domain-containing protein n=1 Tax=Chromera velia CCMP2878 TaxID=1169474 RepID=A0A0G4FA28_9ALVE|eukprot:Cvel_15980.t1-p1 / transcript=Cvel_15980.t1 / gene=Cvel_15980 / organism=Chromera_velia_CCMP2878 / gene_product=Prostaglandin reductase 1, putative / transcript_product=Prostaglandin reductase 1, putative / location=Cvel_scaffold1210:18279-19848(-) / protein_length=350 / sequence_SO=supercontig / SO=protein_coding / is_pseudo=false
MTDSVSSKSLRFRKFRKTGEATLDDFEIVTETHADVPDAHLLVRNIFVSCDPTHRIYLTGEESYVPAFETGGKMPTFIIGEVLKSKLEGHKVGEVVCGFGAWEEYSVLGKEAVLGKCSPDVPLQSNMAVQNPVIGLTAWVGTRRICEISKDKNFVVSGAAGAVGSIACQLGISSGAKVVGICGSDEKCAWLKSIGCHEAINYKKGHVEAELRKACPDGYDGYFENVGGEISEAVLRNMKRFGKIALCGFISHYNHGAAGGYNMQEVLFRRLTVRGFICLDHFADAPECFGELQELLRAGKLECRAHVVDGHEGGKGVEACVEGLVALTRGLNTGKVMVKLGEAPAGYKLA